MSLIVQYKIIGDTLCFSSKENNSKWHIDKITSENLIISTIFEGNENKEVYKFFLTKKHNENYPKSILGDWTAVKMYSSLNDEIEYEPMNNQDYKILTSKFEIISNGKIYLTSPYSIKGDSLIVNNWMTFYIQKLDSNEMVISNDHSKELSKNGEVKAITKLFIKRK